MTAVQFRVNEVFDIPTRGGLIAVGSTSNGEFMGIPRLRDEASGRQIHVLGVDHPTPRTQRTGETILVVDRADADYVTVGRLWTAEEQQAAVHGRNPDWRHRRFERLVYQDGEPAHRYLSDQDMAVEMFEDDDGDFKPMIDGVVYPADHPIPTGPLGDDATRFLPRFAAI